MFTVTVNKSLAFGFDTALGLVTFWTVRNTHPFPEPGVAGQGVTAKSTPVESNNEATAATTVIP